MIERRSLGWLGSAVARVVSDIGGFERQDEPEDRHREASKAASESVRWLHGEMLRIEDHWTNQIQNQQRRIAAIIAVNGFLLAFLASAGLGANAGYITGSRFAAAFYLSLFFLSVALIFGMLLLVPRIGVGAGNKRVSPGEVQEGPGSELLPVSEAEAEDTARARTLHQSRPWYGKVWKWFTSNFFRPTETRPSYWLDSKRVFIRFVASLDTSALDATDTVILDVTESSARNANWNNDLFRTQQARRRWIHWESAFILLGLLALIVTVSGVGYHTLPWVR